MSGETAEFIAKAGYNVTLLEMQSAIAVQIVVDFNDAPLRTSPE